MNKLINFLLTCLISHSVIAQNPQNITMLRIASPAAIESLTYEFINVTKKSADLVLNWETKQFPVKIEK